MLEFIRHTLWWLSQSLVIHEWLEQFITKPEHTNVGEATGVDFTEPLGEFIDESESVSDDPLVIPVSVACPFA